MASATPSAPCASARHFPVSMLQRFRQPPSEPLITSAPLQHRAVTASLGYAWRRTVWPYASLAPGSVRSLQVYVYIYMYNIYMYIYIYICIHIYIHIYISAQVSFFHTCIASHTSPQRSISCGWPWGGVVREFLSGWKVSTVVLASQVLRSHFSTPALLVTHRHSDPSVPTLPKLSTDFGHPQTSPGFCRQL